MERLTEKCKDGVSNMTYTVSAWKNSDNTHTHTSKAFGASITGVDEI